MNKTGIYKFTRSIIRNIPKTDLSYGYESVS